MRRTGLLSAAVAAVAIVISGCSNTDGTRLPSSEPTAERSSPIGTGGAGANLSDDEFVRDVALKHMAAAELSRMALDKATNPAVKTLAQRIITEGSAAGQTLKSAVAGKAGDWPTQLDDKHRETADELAKKQGADFDRAYVEAVIEAQQDLAAKLESRLDVQSLADWKTAAAGRADSNALPEPTVDMRDVPVRPNRSDNEAARKINEWAAETYPVAQKHLDTARTLENAIEKRSTH